MAIEPDLVKQTLAVYSLLLGAELPLSLAGLWSQARRLVGWLASRARPFSSFLGLRRPSSGLVEPSRAGSAGWAASGSALTARVPRPSSTLRAADGRSPRPLIERVDPLCARPQLEHPRAPIAARSLARSAGAEPEPDEARKRPLRQVSVGANCSRSTRAHSPAGLTADGRASLELRAARSCSKLSEAARNCPNWPTTANHWLGPSNRSARLARHPVSRTRGPQARAANWSPLAASRSTSCRQRRR